MDYWSTEYKSHFWGGGEDVMEKAEKKTNKIGLGFLLSWGLGGILVIGGLIELFSKPAMGIFTLLAGLVIFPPAVKFVKSKTNFELSRALKIIVFFVLIGIGGSMAGASGTPTTSSSDTNNQQVQQAKPSDSNQTTNTSNKTEPTATSANKQADVPVEYKSALNKATTYANTMHMSKRGVYDQLVSDYGEKFSAAAAQYAVDNVKADWNANALAKAKTYQDTMSMSPSAIHDQLTSDAGEKFTQAEADYAIQHLTQ